MRSCLKENFLDSRQKELFFINLFVIYNFMSYVSDSVPPHRRQPTRLPRPWDSPGKNTRVGCHFLLECMKVKSESEVAQSCPTLSDLMDCSLPGSSIHGIFQARVLEWGAIAFLPILHMRWPKYWSFSFNISPSNEHQD